MFQRARKVSRLVICLKSSLKREASIFHTWDLGQLKYFQDRFNLPKHDTFLYAISTKCCFFKQRSLAGRLSASSGSIPKLPRPSCSTRRRGSMRPIARSIPTPPRTAASRPRTRPPCVRPSSAPPGARTAPGRAASSRRRKPTAPFFRTRWRRARNPLSGGACAPTSSWTA